VLVVDANFCKNCGAPLVHTVWFNSNIGWRPSVAALLSIVPGLGHWYKGEPGRGVLWLIFVLLLYSYGNLWLGFLLHVICAFNAGLGGAIREEAILKPMRHRMRSHRRDSNQE
jgi:hypothetical protein